MLIAKGPSMDLKTLVIEKYLPHKITIEIGDSVDEAELTQWVPKHINLDSAQCHSFVADSKFKLKVYLAQYIREYIFNVYE